MRALIPLSVVALCACQAPPIDPAFETRVQAGAEILLVSAEARENAVAPFAEISTRDRRTTWQSGDGVSVTTQAGLLQATRGLGGDLLSSDTTQTETRLRDDAPGQSQRFHTFLTGEDKARTRAFVCDVSRRGPRRIDVGRGTEPARLMTETCTGFDDQFTNLYWIAPNGDLLQSRQWAGPFIGPLAIRKSRR